MGIFTEENLSKTKDQDRGSVYLKTVQPIRENGKATYSQETGHIYPHKDT